MKKSISQRLEESCAGSGVCKLDIDMLVKETGLTTYNVYREVMRLSKLYYLKIFTENGTTYVRIGR